jgi:hypothetical protein
MLDEFQREFPCVVVSTMSIEVRLSHHWSGLPGVAGAVVESTEPLLKLAEWQVNSFASCVYYLLGDREMAKLLVDPY